MTDAAVPSVGTSTCWLETVAPPEKESTGRVNSNSWSRPIPDRTSLKISRMTCVDSPLRSSKPSGPAVMFSELEEGLNTSLKKTPAAGSYLSKMLRPSQLLKPFGPTVSSGASRGTPSITMLELIQEHERLDAENGAR